MDPHPKEGVEEHNVQYIINTVTACKSQELAPRRQCAEREVAGEEEIAHEADDVSRRVCDVEGCPHLQQEVYAVMHSRRQCADDAESHELHEFLVVE